ncbi:hypothetical protein M9H77_34614 [Catharanthus roseus]|uniref:Uncharacterized protein n=1 Tax=Catharanthus roseus TaxID=4058 RepID=A0ACB9ZMK7_CATRO|nr:hypothetical protein M9H77_34614 [Catharanthus roseus]
MFNLSTISQLCDYGYKPIYSYSVFANKLFCFFTFWVFIREVSKMLPLLSDVWTYVRSIDQKDGKPRAEYLGCKNVYIAGGSKYGTSTLKHHIDDCVSIRAKIRDVGDMIIDSTTGKARKRNFSQKVLREKIALAIIKHDLPFSFVEYEGIRDIFTYVNLDVKYISRNTATSDVWKWRHVMKRLIQVLLLRR